MGSWERLYDIEGRKGKGGRKNMGGKDKGLKGAGPVQMCYLIHMLA